LLGINNHSAMFVPTYVFESYTETMLD
jgi:hypothetical protein